LEASYSKGLSKRLQVLGGPSQEPEEFGRRHYAQARRRAGLARRKLGPDLNSPAWQHLIQGQRRDLSPEIIAGRLRTFDPRGSMHPLYVSHETMYRAIYGLPRSPVKTELVSHLWQSRAARRRLQRGRRRCFTGLHQRAPRACAQPP
jgi:IS30 family transposase